MGKLTVTFSDGTVSAEIQTRIIEEVSRINNNPLYAPKVDETIDITSNPNSLPGLVANAKKNNISPNDPMLSGFFSAQSGLHAYINGNLTSDPRVVDESVESVFGHEYKHSESTGPSGPERLHYPAFYQMLEKMLQDLHYQVPTGLQQQEQSAIKAYPNQPFLGTINPNQSSLSRTSTGGRAPIDLSPTSPPLSVQDPALAKKLGAPDFGSPTTTSKQDPALGAPGAEQPQNQG